MQFAPNPSRPDPIRARDIASADEPAGCATPIALVSRSYGDDAHADALTRLAHEDGARGPARNVHPAERVASGVAGAGLVLAALRRPSLATGLLALGGLGLLSRSVTGRCPLYARLGLSTATEDRAGESPERTALRNLARRGFEVRHSVQVRRSPEDVFRFWRNFQNLPLFMKHLKDVQVIDDKRSRWIARAPAGASVSWDAQIIDEEPNRSISWRSLPDSQVDNRGTVLFTKAESPGSTDVRVWLEYVPPAGSVGRAVAWLFGENPEHQIRDDLERLRDILEREEPAAPPAYGGRFGPSDAAEPGSTP